MKRPEIDALIHSPSSLPAVYLNYLERRKNQEGITFGVAGLDRWLVPWVGGDLVGLIGRPGHGKTTLAVHLAKRVAGGYAVAGANKCVVYVTADQAVEQVESLIEATPEVSVTDLAFGRYDIEDMRGHVLSRAALPLWLIGESVGGRESAPPLNFANLNAALLRMNERYETQPEVGLVLIDYIQAILFGRPDDRVAEVTDAIRQAKALARRLRCPVVMCVQASRAVDERKQPIPTAGDCQWSSAIEQYADVLLGLWRPIKTVTEREITVRIEGHEQRCAVSSRLLVTTVEKQKVGQSGITVALALTPEAVTLEDWEFARAEY